MKTPMMEFFEEAIKNIGHNAIPKDVIDRYIEKEKQVIIDAFLNSDVNPTLFPKHNNQRALNYYNEKYDERRGN